MQSEIKKGSAEEGGSESPGSLVCSRESALIGGMIKRVRFNEALRAKVHRIPWLGLPCQGQEGAGERRQTGVQQGGVEGGVTQSLFSPYTGFLSM